VHSPNVEFAILKKAWDNARGVAQSMFIDFLNEGGGKRKLDRRAAQ
jgi:hypothetical protein